MFKIITLDLTRIGHMQLSCNSIKVSVICSKSSLKSNLKDQDSMFKHQSGHISIMNTGHETNLTAILDLHIPLALSVKIHICCGWLGRAMVLGSFQCRGVLLLWHMVGQWLAVLAAGAERVGCFFFFLLFCCFFFCCFFFHLVHPIFLF